MSNGDKSFLTQWSLPVLCALFALLAIGYASVTPYRTGGVLLMQGRAPAADIGAPDERQHVNYIVSLRTTGELPVLRPSEPNFYETYQAHQPPLYYALMAPLATPGDPNAQNGIALRFPNALIGAVTVAGLFMLGLWSSGRRLYGFGLASIAFLPGFLMLHGAVTNDPLLICFITWSLAWCARAVALPDAEAKRAVLIAAILAGLGCATKSSGLLLLPIVGLVGLWRLKSTPLAWVRLLPLVLIPAPLWVRNTSLYGDPLGLKVFESAFQGSAKASMFIDALGAQTYWTQWVAWWTARSGVGVFGYMDVFLPDGVYRVAFAGVLVAAIGWMVALRRGEQNPIPKVVTLMLAGFFALVLLTFLRFNSVFFQAQFRYLFPAIASLGLFFGVGAARWGRIGALALMTSLIALNLFTLSWLPGEFARRVVPSTQSSLPTP